MSKPDLSKFDLQFDQPEAAPAASGPTTTAGPDLSQFDLHFDEPAPRQQEAEASAASQPYIDRGVQPRDFGNPVGLAMDYAGRQAIEDQRNKRVAELFRVGIQDAPEKDAGANNLAEDLGLPGAVDLVKEHYDEFRRTAEAAKLDPAQWRRDNPTLDLLLDERPHMAGVIVRDAKITKFVDNANLDKNDPLLSGPQGVALRALGLGKHEETTTERRVYQDKSTMSGPAAVWDALKRSATQSPLAKLQALQLVLDLSASGTTPKWVPDAPERSVPGVARGGDVEAIPGLPGSGHWEQESNRVAAERNRERILRMGQNLGLEPYYGDRPVVNALATTAEAATGSLDSFAAQGLGIAGAALGFPEIAIPAAQFLSAGSSFVTETGGAYAEFTKLKDDAGSPVDRRLAAAGSVVYGAVASLVENGFFKVKLATLGGLGEAAAAGRAKEWIKNALRDRAGREIFADLSKHLGEHALSEGKEESLQQLAQVALRWATQSASAKKFQSFNPEAATEEIVGAGLMGALGAATTGLAFNTTVDLYTSLNQIYRSRASGQAVAAITDLAKSDTARHAPAEIANLIAHETEISGEKVSHLYVDPVQLAQIVQENGGDVTRTAHELMGPDGPERLKRATAEAHDSPGNRATLAVPVQEYVEKWGPKPIAEMLKQDVATRPGSLTMREMAQSGLNVEGLRSEIEKLKASEPTEEPLSPAEEEFTDKIQKQALATGMDAYQAKQSALVWRAMIRTSARALGQNADEQFSKWTVTVQNESEEPLATQFLRGHVAAMNPETDHGLTSRANLLYVDKNAGIYNERGFKAAFADKSEKPLLARYKVEGVKWKNKESHTAGNLLYRLAGQALNDVAPDSAAKWGGDFVSLVDTDQEAQDSARSLESKIKERLVAANKSLAGKLGGLTVVAATAPRAGGLDAAYEAAGKTAGATASRMEGEGKRAKRGETPLGLPVASPEELTLPAQEAAPRALPASLTAKAKAMSPQTVFDEALVDSKTGMLSKEGWDAIPRKKHIIPIDLNGLAAINSKLGTDAGDAALSAFAEVSRVAGASAMDMAHLSGDEFVAQTDDKEIAQYFVDILGELAQGVKVETRSGELINGITFGYGIAGNYDAADKLVEQHKQRERQSPGTERSERASRALDRRSRGVPQGAESLAGGNAPQGEARVREHTRAGLRRARAAARAQEAVRQLRLAALREADPQVVAQKLLQTESTEADAAARVAKVVDRAPADIRSNERAYNEITSQMPADWVSPSSAEDRKYANGEKPGPFGGGESGIFDSVNELLGLTGSKKVSGGREAFDRLMSHFDGDRQEKLQQAVAFMRRNVPGYEKMDLTQEMIDQANEADDQRRVAEAFDQQGSDDSTLFQPAFHGTPHRGIESDGFKLNKIGTGEGAQAYGWGIYFSSHAGVAEWYRSKLAGGRSVLHVNGQHYDTMGSSDLKEALFHVAAQFDTNKRSKVSATQFADAIEKARARLRAQIAERTEQIAKAPSDLHKQIAERGLSSARGELRALQHVTPDMLSFKAPGQTYKADVPEDADLLDRETLLGDQSANVKSRLRDAGLWPEFKVEANPSNASHPWRVAMYIQGKLRLVENFHESEAAATADARKLSEDPRITGAQLYNMIEKNNEGESKGFGPSTEASKAASDQLMKAGIPGLRYLDQVSRSDGEGTHNFVIWDESRMPITETLYHETADADARGYIKIARDGAKTQFNIFLRKNSDPSTFLHESAHAYFEMLGDLSEHPSVEQRVKGDYDTILKWLGAESRSSVTVEQKEKFARGFEAFMMEGAAPSSALAEAFESFRRWLVRIYKTLSQLNVELTPEIRGVFSRMLATDDEIKNMEHAAGLDVPMYKSPAEAKMTGQEWENYLKQRQAVTTHVAMRTRRIVAEARARAAEAFKSREFKKYKQAAEEEWDNRKDVQAWRYIRNGEKTLADGRTVTMPIEAVKMDRERVVAILGEDSPLIKKLLRGRLSEDGAHPGLIAQQLGYQNAQEMLAALAAIPEKDPLVESRAQEMMREANHEIDGEIADLNQKIQEMLHGEGALDQHLREMADLRRKAGKDESTNPAASVRQAAKEIVAKRRAGRLDIGQTLNRERAAAERVAMYAAKGDYDNALLAKQQQLLQYHVWRELTEAGKERTRFLDLARRLSDRKTRERLGKAGADLVDASDQILESLDLKEPESRIDRAPIARALYAIEQGETGASFAVDDIVALVSKPPDGGWRNLDVSQMRSAHRALAQIWAMARARNEVILDGKRIEISKLADTIANDLSERPDMGPPGDEGRWAGFQAARLQPQEVLRRFGPTAYKAIWRGNLEAQKAEDLLLEKTGKFIAESWESVPKKIRNSMTDVLEDTRGVEIPADVDKVVTQDRRWMLMVALNMGNASNKERLLGGYGWNDKAVVDWLGRNMTGAEWDFVESVWEMLDKHLYPQVAATYAESNGLAPDKIEAQPFEVMVDGERRVVSGGYFPARYDPIASRRGAQQSLQDLETNYHKSAGAISVAKSFTKSRVNRYSDVVSLDWGVVPGHVMTVIHYVAFDRFVRQSKAILGHETVRYAAMHRIGQKNYENLVADGGWLATVASAAADAVPRGLRDIYSVLGVGKKIMLNAAIGFRVATSLGDFADPLKRAFAGKQSRIGMTYVLGSMARAYSTLPLQIPGLDRANLGYAQMRREALEKSHELRRHVRDFRRKAIEELGAPGRNDSGPARLLHKVQESGMIFMDWSGRIMGTVIWDAAYRESLANGMSESESVAHADDIVAIAMPTQDPTRRSPLLRDRRGIGQFLVFFTYMEKLHNEASELLDDVHVAWGNAEGPGEKIGAVGTAAARTGQVLAIFAVAQLLGEFLQGRGPEKDEDVPRWVMRKMLAAPFVKFPFVGYFAERKIDEAITGRRKQASARGTPIENAINTLDKVMQKAAKDFEDRRLDHKDLLDAVEVIGLLTGTPTGSGQFSRTAQYLENPQDRSTLGTIKGLTYGEPAPH